MHVRGGLRPLPARGSLMRKHIAVLACAGLVFGACGNVTTREERLAARGISADQTATTGGSTDGVSNAGPAPASEVVSAPSSGSTGQAAVGTGAGPSAAAVKAPASGARAV